MKSVFEDIYSRKWLKAQKDYEKILEKSVQDKVRKPDYTNTQLQALYPLPQLAMAILLSTDYSGLEASQRPTYSLDYEKAYSLLKCALTYSEKGKLNAFLSDPEVNVNLNMLEDRIEDALCNKATKENTEKAYDAVIDSLLPQSLRLQSMKIQREDLVYNNIMNSPTEAECQRFLSKYFDGRVAYHTAVSHILDSLQYHAIDGSIESIERYIATHPKSSLLHNAEDKLESIEYQAIRPTAASCKKYLDKYPTSKHTLEVKKRYTELAYKEAVAAGTAEAYLTYCKDFPYDLHYQNVFDSLLYRTVTCIYDTVLACKTPDMTKYLSSAFLESVKNREAAMLQMREKGLVPPRTRNMWIGVATTDSICPFDSMEISQIDLKSKTAASVHVLLNGFTMTPAAKNGDSPTPTQIQTDLYMDFIIEDNSLKLDDIRLDDGKSSVKSGSL